MPSDQLDVLRPPQLAPVSDISRRVSTPEYYHACVGISGKTLESTRCNGFMMQGHSSLTAAQWQQALNQVAAVNPGVRLRLTGYLWWSSWRSDGALPTVRVIEDCDWDLQSSRGAEFIHATPFPLRTGPTVELVVARLRDGSTLLVLRSHHAVMDGIGSMHVYEELFRALRGEPLLGSNAGYSEVELMLSTGAKESTSHHIKTTALTGSPAGDDIGDEWRRITLGPPRGNMLALVAAAMTEFMHQHSDLPALFGVPVNLRRHAPGLLSPTNFSNMLLVKMERGDGAEQFKQRLKDMLAARMDAVYPRILDLFRGLPLSWMDRLLSRNLKNYRTRKALETAVISNLGRWEQAPFSCPGFQAQRMVLVPLAGSIFSTMVCMGEDVELTINMPKVLASNGRFDAFERFLRERFAS